MDIPHIFPTVVHMLLDAADRAPDRDAVICDGESLTYGELLRCVSGFAAELREMGAAGERVAIIMGNSLDICIAMFGAHMARAQVTPLNPVYTAQELRPMLADASPSVLLYDEDNAARDELLGTALNIPHRICIGNGRGSRRLTEWSADGHVAIPSNLPAPEDLGTLQFTGGTTGRSKGADITHRSTAVNISQREALCTMRDDVERCLCVMPLFHCYASHMNLHAMVYRRGTLIVHRKYHPAQVLDAIERERITIFGGSPTLFNGLISFPQFKHTDFSSLYLSSSGSAPLPEALIEKWESATGTPVVEGYGQSEAGPVISFNPVTGIRKLGSVGLPVPHTALEIVDIETGTKKLGCGQRGEIRLSGPQVMTGYRDRSEETAQTLREGWLYTGDIGELDEDGYLFIRGRKKEMIIVSGYNVFPREVEEILQGHPDVQDAAVVGKPDDYRGELPVAFIVPRPGSTPDCEKLMQFCSGVLAKYKLPSEFILVSELPKTTVGKVNKIALTEMAAHVVTRNGS